VRKLIDLITEAQADLEQEAVPALPDGDDLTRQNLTLLRARMDRLLTAIRAEMNRSYPYNRTGISATKRKRIKDKSASERGKPFHARKDWTPAEAHYYRLMDKKDEIVELLGKIDEILPNLPKPEKPAAKRKPIIPPEADEFI
jgi:hypothetical protein